jgi:hypothetical protein
MSGENIFNKYNILGIQNGDDVECGLVSCGTM